MYKILSCIFIIIFSAAAYSQSISMSAPAEVTGTAETQFVIQIKAGDPNSVSNFLGASFNLTWNNTSYVEAVSTAAGNFLGSNPLIIAQNYNDHIEVGVTSTTGGKNVSGVIAQCTLKVKQNVSGLLTVSFNLQNITGMDGLGNSLILTPANNPLEITLQTLPALTVTPDNQNVNPSSGSTSFGVSNSGGGTLNWSASETSDWVTITSGSTGTNSGIIQCSYTANTSCETRVCTLTVSASGAAGSPKYVTVTQSGNNIPVLSVSPLNHPELSSAGGTSVINVSNTGCGTLNWNASENADWMTITSGSNGTNNGNINLSYTANTGCETRTCTLTVTAAGASGSPKTVTFTQPGSGTPVLDVNPSSLEFLSSSGTAEINVSNSGCGTLNWSATENAEWITITSGSTGINNGSININYTANSSCDARVCTLSVSSPEAAGSPELIIITQSGNNIPILTADPLTQNLSSSAGNTTINILNSGCGTLNWNAEENSEWVSIISGNTGTNSGTVNISFTANSACEARVCTLTVTATGAAASPQKIILTQPGSGTPILSVSPAEQNLSPEKGTLIINIYNQGCGTLEWTAAVQEGSEWFKIDEGAAGSDSGEIICSYESNNTNISRIAKLHIYNDDDSAVVTITQDFATGVFDDFIVKENFLYQNYPNPFNPSTVIRYSLLQESNVTIKLYDVLGNEIITLADEYKSPGIYSVEVDARSITSGIYYYRITADNFVQTKKMILVK